MANKNISMSTIKQIVKLKLQGIGKKRIANRLGISKNTVNVYLRALCKLGVPYGEMLKLSDFELDQLLHPPQQTIVNEKVQQLFDFFPEMERQLRRRGMTVARQFIEFKSRHPQGFGETAFYKYYNQWKRTVNPTMHIEHKVGDKMYVDYAGATLPYVEEGTGELMKAQVFVAILGWSQYTYVEAVADQTIEEFITGCENALYYFKGVPLAIVPDNLKSAVFKASRYEPLLNDNFRCFAEHYGTAILPARSRKPRDKAHVENMVKIAYQRIYTTIPEDQHFSLQALNQRIQQSLAGLNSSSLTGRKYSRADQWILEQPTLHPLAPTRFEMRKIKQVTVMKNGHVYLAEDQHYYSVPYELIGKKLRLQYSRSVVELFHKYTMVACHKRIKSAHTYTTESVHMPPQHQFVTEWNPRFFLDKAKQIDPEVENFIREVLARKTHPEQAYKSCMGILSFAKRVGNARLIKACRRAHQIGYYNYRTIEDILKKHLDKYEEDPDPVSMPLHDNIRGGKYYQ